VEIHCLTVSEVRPPGSGQSNLDCGGGLPRAWGSRPSISSLGISGKITHSGSVQRSKEPSFLLPSSHLQVFSGCHCPTLASLKNILRTSEESLVKLMKRLGLVVRTLIFRTQSFRNHLLKVARCTGCKLSAMCRNDTGPMTDAHDHDGAMYSEERRQLLSSGPHCRFDAQAVRATEPQSNPRAKSRFQSPARYSSSTVACSAFAKPAMATTLSESTVRALWL
jgi:hypothetical protein